MAQSEHHQPLPEDMSRCNHPDCNGTVFNSEKALHRHWAEEDSHDYCKPCKYMANSYDELTDHKANSPKLHICCKFCGQDFKNIRTRDIHVRKMHPVEQDLRCIGCKEHFVRGYALIGHLEFDHCRAIPASQFKSCVEHTALVNKMLEDPDYVKTKEFDGATALATDGSTYASTDFDDASTIGGGSTVGGRSTGNHILDEDDCSAVDSQEGGVPIAALLPEVKSQPRKVAHPVDNFPALPGAKNSTPMTWANKAAAPRRAEDFPPLPGPKSYASVSQLSRATSQMSLNSSTGSERTVLKNGSNAWETSSQSSEVLFKGTGTRPFVAVQSSTTSSTLFSGAEKTPLDAKWKQALAERDLEYEDRTRCNPFLLRFWDPEHPQYDPERFFHNTIGKYICPLSKCEAHFFEPSKMTEHLLGKHIITQVRCPTCSKLFNSCSALLAHCENASSECRVAHTRDFWKVVDLFSGGFLGIKDAHRSDITDQDRQDRRDDYGLRIVGSGMKSDYIKYIATVPNDWAGAGSATSRQTTTVGRTWDDGSGPPRRFTGTMNPSVPISSSRKFARSTASIYPELVYPEGDEPNGTSAHMIDPNARRDRTGIYVVPEEYKVMRREDMKYIWEMEETNK
ncbi:uncharacterized protein J3D65DRAFT_170209 [Phyllosticta citribraziliensis]|uniref:C2H2-type domain-containing protein n=1 Tax=Phyllosticta citribraziliensis TaxID=989973 RepID=A0ABR1L4E0_9PEZI